MDKKIRGQKVFLFNVCNLFKNSSIFILFILYSLIQNVKKNNKQYIGIVKSNIKLFSL